MHIFILPLLFSAYRTDDSKPWVLPVVRKAEKDIAADETLNHEYLPILGLESFCTAACRIVFGEDHKVIKEGKVLIFK